MIYQHHIKSRPYDNYLEDGLHHLHQGALGKNPAEAIDGIQLIKLRLHGLRVEMKPHLIEIDAKAYKHDS